MSGGPFARRGRDRPFVYGHRGTRRGAPENTLLAMQRAITQGADGIELDVRLCGSGEVVVVHDPDLQRVAGVALVVAATPLQELRRQPLGDGERVPTLDAALDLVLSAGRLLNVELKPDVPDRQALVDAVAACLHARAAAARELVMLSSFGRGLCAMLRATLPEVPVAYLFQGVPDALPAGVCAVHPDHGLVDAAAVADWHAAGLVVNAWTVNDREHARSLAQAGVDGIITDDVPLVLAALAQAG